MAEQDSYIPPKVWKWNKESGGRFANINRPIAGPTHEQDLPAGEHDLQLHSLATPNGVKVTVLLEELLELGIEGAEYEAGHLIFPLTFSRCANISPDAPDVIASTEGPAPLK